MTWEKEREEKNESPHIIAHASVFYVFIFVNVSLKCLCVFVCVCVFHYTSRSESSMFRTQGMKCVHTQEVGGGGALPSFLSPCLAQIPFNGSE